MDSSIISLLSLIFFEFVIGVITIVVLILFLISLSKLIDATRSYDLTTQISKVWVWTQLIPYWNIVAMVVYHIKMSNAISYIEDVQDMPTGSINYPIVTGWVYIFTGFLLSILDFLHISNFITIIIGVICVICFIIFWVKVSNTTKAINSLE